MTVLKLGKFVTRIFLQLHDILIKINEQYFCRAKSPGM
jgi:hypothetical protein